ncbi:MAG: prolyl oligopeptidase family serine peptidase [Nitrosomonadaceae bacterium]
MKSVQSYPNSIGRASLLIVLILILLPSHHFAQEIKHEDYTWVHRSNCTKNIAYGEEEDQILDIYTQGDWIGPPNYFAPDTLLKPTIIFYHGGGWFRGQKDDYVYLEFILNFLKNDWNVVNVEYRCGANTISDAVDDAICAINWVAENAYKFNIDTERIVIYGVSAGGHLGLIAGLLNNTPESHPSVEGNNLNICAIVNWFGFTDIQEHYEYKLKKGDDRITRLGDNHEEVAKISAKYSPVNHVTKSTPPIISIHGDSDEVVLYSHSEILHNLLDDTNLPNQLVTLHGGKHMGFTRKQFQHIYEQIFQFLDVHMD